MRSERHLVLAKLALGASLAGMVLFVVVAVMSMISPRTWTMIDAANTMLAAEVGAFFLGSLAYRTGIGISAMIISGVLALGCFLTSR